MKTCTKCKIEKELIEFRKSSRGSKDGLGSWCKKCMSNATVVYMRKRLKTEPEYRKEITRKQTEYMRNRKKIDLAFKQQRVVHNRRQNLKRNYSITLEQYDQMLQKQNGVCAICKSTNNGRTLHVDHCHTSGKIRGLLCHDCNIKLASLENTSFISLANIYLSTYS